MSKKETSLKQIDKTETKNAPRRHHVARIIGWCIFFVAGTVGIVVAGVGTAYGIFHSKYDQRFYPGVNIQDIHLSGLTYLDAYERLEQKIKTIETKGITVRFAAAPGGVRANADVNLLPLIPAFDATMNDQELYHIEWKSVLDSAYAFGRGKKWQQNIREQIFLFLTPRTLFPHVTLNEELLRNVLKETFDHFEQPAVDATLALDTNGNIVVHPEKVGTHFNADVLVATITAQLMELNATPIVLKLEDDFPSVTSAALEKERTTIVTLLDRAPLSLTFSEDGKNEQTWSIDRSQLVALLAYASGSFHIDAETLKKNHADIGETLNRLPKEGRFEIIKDNEGKLIDVRAFEESKPGLVVDYAKTADAMTLALQIMRAKNIIPISVAITEPTFTPEKINTLGIHDILGTGHSNMGGSPTNRRGNIARGVALLNGLLIAPNEEFSLLGALKPFTVENGYLPELVIKGNKTTPEIGGGLCQIGTTTFRGAMSAGLDITKRQNHSYAVSYYADDRNHQPGTDATIYDPAPDFAFINDTPGYILLQTRVEGNDLYFDFWGTRDGRIAEFSPPVTSNWIQPPALKEIETTELAPGERKCTESAHAGVSAAFTYAIDYADGKRHEEEFRSVYKPWQAVCLVGVAKEEQKPASAAAEKKNR